MHAAPQPKQYEFTPGCGCGVPRRRASDALTVDLSPREIFTRAKKLERQYATRLRTIAKIIDHIIRGFDMLTPDGIKHAEAALRNYANTLTPWATAVAQRMLAEVQARDDRQWRRISALMGRELRKEIEQAPTGQLMRTRLQEQVSLITSLPRQAAERVHHLAQEGRIKGTRADVIAKDIMRTGEVTQARANTIARTETTRTATELTAARAQYVGSTHFIWRTSGDSDVRATHKKLNGKVFRWDDPPVCDHPDLRALPGAIFNCRCRPEPILPGDALFEKYK